MLEPFLEGQTMDAALAANRIFIVDLEILSRLKLDGNKKVGHFKIGKMCIWHVKGTKWKQDIYYSQIWCICLSFTAGAFLWDDPNREQWTKITLIKVGQRNDHDFLESSVSLMHHCLSNNDLDYFKGMLLSFGHGIPFAVWWAMFITSLFGGGCRYLKWDKFSRPEQHISVVFCKLTDARCTCKFVIVSVEFCTRTRIRS